MWVMRCFSEVASTRTVSERMTTSSSPASAALHSPPAWPTVSGGSAGGSAPVPLLPSGAGTSDEPQAPEGKACGAIRAVSPGPYWTGHAVLGPVLKKGTKPSTSSITLLPLGRTNSGFFPASHRNEKPSSMHLRPTLSTAGVLSRTRTSSCSSNASTCT